MRLRRASSRHSWSPTLAKFVVIRKSFSDRLYNEGEVVNATSKEDIAKYRANVHFEEIKGEPEKASLRSEGGDASTSRPHKKIEVK